MADELDKFVLQYTVDMKDAIAKLEQLQKKMGETGDKSGKSGKKVKGFADGVKEEIEGIVPVIGKATDAITRFGMAFGVATAAAGALALGVKAVMDMRERYNTQRAEGMKYGISDIRMEEYQRKFVKASGGHVTREQTAAEVGKLSKWSSEIYADPYRLNQASKTAQILGIDMGEPGKPKTVNELLTQIGGKLHDMTPEQAKGFATTMGMNQDFALGLQKQGTSVGRFTETTQEELEHRKNSQKNLDQFNESLEKLADNFKRAENILGEQLLGPFGAFVDQMAKLSDLLPHATSSLTKEDAAPGFLSPLGAVAGPVSMLSDMIPAIRKIGEFFGIAPTKGDKSADQKVATKNEKAAEMNQSAAETSAEAQDEENERAKIIADQQNLAINQFVGAVASFANAIDERRAWAAWAGEIGRASGLSGPKDTLSRPTGAIGVLPYAAATKYDAEFKAAGEKYNVDPNLIKNIAWVESGFQPKIVSNQGAVGLMQVMPSNFKSLGIKDATDPMQNIMGGTKLFAQYLKDAGGDTKTALMMYHGGYKRSGWGPKTMAYPEKVLGMATAQEGDGVAHGLSKEYLSSRNVQASIAARLDVPLASVQQGRQTRGDVEFAESQLERGIQNRIFHLQNQLKFVNLPTGVMRQLNDELRENQSDLIQLRTHGSQAIAEARPGERSITLNEHAIVINIGGQLDAEKAADAVHNRLTSDVGDLLNGTSTGMKY